MSSPKVIGIGLHKSGTSSLATALYTLGYGMTGHGAMGSDFDYGRLLTLDPADARAEVWARLEPDLQRADAAQDSPWWDFYREIDEAFPGSRFVLTVRNREKWLGSVQAHFGRRSNEWDRWFFNDKNSVDDPQVFLDRYDDHHRSVHEYFAGREDDLLVIDMAEGMSWGPLCEFVGLPTPGYSFPKANAAGERETSFVSRAVRKLRRTIDERSGRSDVQRTLALYRRCHEVTSGARETVVNRGGDVDAFATALMPRVITLKTALGVPYQDGGTGDYGDDALGRWRQFEFELRHGIGQISTYTVDVDVDGSTIGRLASDILDDVVAFGES